MMQTQLALRKLPDRTGSFLKLALKSIQMNWSAHARAKHTHDIASRVECKVPPTGTT